MKCAIKQTMSMSNKWFSYHSRHFFSSGSYVSNHHSNCPPDHIIPFERLMHKILQSSFRLFVSMKNQKTGFRRIDYTSLMNRIESVWFSWEYRFQLFHTIFFIVHRIYGGDLNIHVIWYVISMKIKSEFYDHDEKISDFLEKLFKW